METSNSVDDRLSQTPTACHYPRTKSADLDSNHFLEPLNFRLAQNRLQTLKISNAIFPQSCTTNTSIQSTQNTNKIDLMACFAHGMMGYCCPGLLDSRADRVLRKTSLGQNLLVLIKKACTKYNQNYPVCKLLYYYYYYYFDISQLSAGCFL